MITPMHFLSLNTTLQEKEQRTPPLTYQGEDDSNDPDYQNDEFTAQEISETWEKRNEKLEQFWKWWRENENVIKC